MLHLGILVENMRREGFEFQIGPPKVILKKGDDDKKLEPFDEATVDVPEEHVGPCVDLLGSRKGVMQDMVTTNVCFWSRKLSVMEINTAEHGISACFFVPAFVQATFNTLLTFDYSSVGL